MMPSILTLADLDFCDQLARRRFLRPLCTPSFSFAVPEIALAVELSLCVHVRPRVVFICQSAGRDREITDCGHDSFASAPCVVGFRNVCIYD